jgi:hypothetical protein
MIIVLEPFGRGYLYGTARRPAIWHPYPAPVLLNVA